jgi:hypothetical protein
MPRFVVLHHETPAGYARPPHWDFMLETGGALRTWVLAEQPGGPRVIAAEALDDHRLDYLEFEGEVSGGRGTVTRWDQGTYAWIYQSRGEMEVALRGSRLLGRARLTLENPDRRLWRFAFAAD